MFIYLLSGDSTVRSLLLTSEGRSRPGPKADIPWTLPSAGILPYILSFKNCFRICFKLVKNGLPALLLHFMWEGLLRVETFNYFGEIFLFRKMNFHLSAIIQGIVNIFQRLYFIILTAEIKTLTSVFCFHP